ncbi:MAG: hypothetical protein QOK03_2497 [Candidatus Binataceae bacterium]|jgi:hypothetical protein|nr:hypothetical protein [Candidatus Binataceae bacterium]
MAGRALAPLRKIVPLRKTIRTGKGSAIAPLRKTMRTVKATAIVLLVALYTLALGGPPAIAPLWAQTTNPLIAPVPPPAAPSQLPAPVTTAIAPILAPVPTLALATPTPLLRVFNCSCSGRGVGTNWMGRVTAGGYFAARQGAVGACLTYNRIREPLTPTQTARSATTTVPILPGASVPGAAAQLTSTLPGTLKPSTATDLQNCSNCVCD